MNVPWQRYPDLERIWTTAGSGKFTRTLMGFESTMLLIKLEGYGAVKRTGMMPLGAIIWQLTSSGKKICVLKFGPEPVKARAASQVALADAIAYEISIRGKKRVVV